MHRARCYTLKYISNIIVLLYLSIVLAVVLSAQALIAPTTSVILANSTYSLWNTVPVVINISSINAVLIVNSSSPTRTTAGIEVFSLNNPAIQSPSGYTPFIVLNVSISSPVNVTATLLEKNSCTLNSQISPFSFQNGTWNPIRGFALNHTSCVLSFVFPQGRLIGLFRRYPLANNTLPTVYSTIPATTLTTTGQPSQKSSNPVQISNAAIAAAVVGMILVVVGILIFCLLRAKRGRAPPKPPVAGRAASEGHLPMPITKPDADQKQSSSR